MSPRTATRTPRPRPRSAADLPLTWHFVGQLQTNKVRSVVGYADVVQSVDRLQAGHRALGGGGARRSASSAASIQVALDAEAGERGASGAAWRRTGSRSWPTAVAGAPGLRLDGLMTVAPLAGPYAGRQRAAFERLMEFVIPPARGAIRLRTWSRQG